MAAGVIRHFLVQAPTPAYFPLTFQGSPCNEDDGDVEMLEERPELREDEEEQEEEEEDEESEAQEEEEEDGLEVFLNPASYTLDVTKQLLRFADVISLDVQRFFGPVSCDIYSDSVSVTTSGRLRYYDDLLKIAKAGSLEEPESSSVTCADEKGVGVAKGNSGLGPLAELFHHRGPSQARSRPMSKRHLPLSFWTEPIPCCSLVSFSNESDVTHTNSEAPPQDDAHGDAHAHMHYNPLPRQSTHALDGTQPDFSDLLANWDPNPELTHTLTENTHLTSTTASFTSVPTLMDTTENTHLQH